MTRATFLLILFIWILSHNPLFSQDPHFSQFFGNRLYLNAAYAGFDRGVTATLNHRDQWFGIPDTRGQVFGRGYQTLDASVSLQLPCILESDNLNAGLALTLLRDEAAAGPLVTTGVGIAGSQEFRLVGDRNGLFLLKRLDIRVGGQLAFQQRQLNDQFLIYSYQLDPVVGLLEPPASLNLRTSFYPNMSAGILLRGNLSKNKYRDNQFTLGLNLANINKPVVALNEAADDYGLPWRWTMYAGSSILVTRYKGVRAPWYISPQFRWDAYPAIGFNLQTLGFYVFEKAYYFGLFYQYNFPNAADTAPGFYGRNTNVLAINVGMDIRTVMDNGRPWRHRESGVIVGLSYDVNVAGLDASAVGGALELTLRATFTKDKKPRRCGAELARSEIYNGKCPINY